MNKQDAINIIESTFNKKFDNNNFTLFIKNLLNDIDTTKYNEYRGNLIKESFREHIRQYWRIGKYTDPNGEALDVLIVEIKDHSKLERARTSLRNFIITHLNSFEKDYALVAFYSNTDNGSDWRFSFVKLEYTTEVKDGKLKQNKEITPAKRYSFLVGEHERAHTAKKQLLPLLENVYNNPTIEELEEAFSIETVTDEFFEQYKALFIKLSEHFEKDKKLKAELASANIDIPRFTKKLLGQIVFLYFLQKKGWLGVDKDKPWGTGNRKYLQSLFDVAIENNQNFFGDYLQYLFYEALANEHKDEGIKGYYKRLDCRIPFLNGGLFEADYNWQTDNITIPNELFRNDEKIKNGDIGTGVLDVFDRYNFTIKEDEPLEKEVAVDPEMLGKVFENMLEVTERKSKGAFYTPREIVHYMCQESLIHYLDNSVNSYSKTYQELGNSQTSLFGNNGVKGQQSLLNEKDNILIPVEDLEFFIKKGFFTLENDLRVLHAGKETKSYEFKLPETIRKNADLLDEKLSNIKICDPAIGSGAFPVGLLHELINAQLVLKQHLSTKYYNKKLEKIGLNSNDDILDKYTYRIKRYAIQESIYGVDIDASAIDIARLRLWLSLVVDEDDLDSIEALPNLDYKIISGNSLIGLPENAMRDLEVEKQIESLKEEFFIETNETKKRKLRTEINSKIRQLLDSAEQFAGYKIAFDFKLFFSEVWHEKNGFDILIGNPPYGALLSNEEKKFFKTEFSDVHMRTPDTFNYFISKGFRNLREDGVISYIVPNNLFFQTEFEKTRRFLLSKNQFKIGINLGDGIFNTATVPSCIFLSTKRKRSSDQYKYADIRKLDKHKLDFRTILNIESISSTFNVPAAVFGISEKEFKIITKLKNVSTTIDSIAEEMASGISTGGDKIFRVSKKFAEENKLEVDLLKPVLVGSEIDRYRLNNSDHFIIYTDRNTIINNYPQIKSYLIEFKEKLEKRSEAKAGIMPWFALNRQRYPMLFEEEKIILRQTSDNIRATYDTNSFYVIDSILVFKKDKSSSFKYEYILAILNSSIVEFLYRKFTQEVGRTFAQVKPLNVRKLYIPNASENSQYIVSILVNYLLNINNLDEDFILIRSYLESILDVISLELFLPKEIEIAQKQIIKYLHDIKSIQSQMSNEEIISTIQSEFERLYDPNHPVRNIVETIDSIPEVRTIKEALK